MNVSDVHSISRNTKYILSNQTQLCRFISPEHTQTRKRELTPEKFYCRARIESIQTISLPSKISIRVLGIVFPNVASPLSSLRPRGLCSRPAFLFNFRGGAACKLLRKSSCACEWQLHSRSSCCCFVRAIIQRTISLSCKCTRKGPKGIIESNIRGQL